MVTRSITVDEDGYIHQDGLSTPEVSSDGYIIIPIFNRFTSVDSDAIIAEKTSVFCDGIVTTEVGSGRYIKSYNSSLSSLSDWYLSCAENINGTTYAKSSVIVPYEYLCNLNSNVTGIIICLNMQTNLGDILTITLQEGSTILGTTTFNNPWTPTGSLTPGWFFITFPTPISQLSGHLYKVVISGGDNSGIQVTDNAIGAGGILGRVLNCIVVTDVAATILDSRPMMVLPKSHGTTLGSLTLSSSSITTDALYLGVGTTLNLATTENVVMTINKLFNLSPYTNLNMLPDSSHTHTIKYGINAGLINYGSITMTGYSKTRYAQTIASTTQFSTSLTLDQTPNWVVGDRIYIASSDNQMGSVCIVASVSGSTVTLQSGVGRNNEAGVYVFCLSRSVSMSGYSSSAKAGIVLKPYSSFIITHGEMKAFNTLFPDPLSTCTLSDVVLSDNQIYDYETASVGLKLSNINATDLAFIRNGTGLTTQGNVTLSGKTLIAGIYTTGIIVKTGKLIADIISTNVDTASVILSGATLFDGKIINDYAKSLTDIGSLIKVQGIVEDIQLSGRLKTASTQTGSVVSIDAASGLNNLYGYQITTDNPYINAKTGSLFVGNVRLVECVSTASKLVKGNVFIHMIDEDGIVPVSGFITGSIVSGALIANKFRTETKTGAHSSYNDIDYGQIMKIEGTLHRVELARVSANNGELVKFGCISKGPGRFIIESAIAPDVTYEVTNTSFAAQEFQTTATANGIVVVSFEADTVAYLDRLVRL